MVENVVISNIKGGFGNQLFQFATGLSVSIRTNAEFLLDLSFFELPQYSAAFRLNMLAIDYKIADKSVIAELSNESGSPPFYSKVLNKFNIHNKFGKKTHFIDSAGFKPSVRFQTLTPSVYIEGWCVKEVYFRSIRNTLQKLFTPKENFSHIAQRYLEKIVGSNSVSIHVRRGDYVNNPVFHVIPLKYYSEAIEKISNVIENPVFFVFSDDIEWCRMNFVSANNFYFVDLNSYPDYNGQCDIEDFFLMKNCKHNITANSSYSWWAGYLNENPNPLIFSPLVWYKSHFYQKSLDKYPFISASWIRL